MMSGNLHCRWKKRNGISKGLDCIDLSLALNNTGQYQLVVVAYTADMVCIGSLMQVGSA